MAERNTPKIIRKVHQAGFRNERMIYPSEHLEQPNKPVAINLLRCPPSPLNVMADTSVTHAFKPTIYCTDRDVPSLG